MLFTHGKLTGRTQQTFEDPTGMGRWSGFRLEGSSSHIVNVVCAYRVCQPDSSTHSSANTAQAQQRRIMNLRQYPTANPRTQILIDLTHLLTEWRNKNEEFLLMIDANNSGEFRDVSAWNSFVTRNSLFDVHDCKHGMSEIPPTYNRGKTQIDHILCSPALVPAIRRCGFYPFDAGPVHTSDHRAIFCDFDLHILLGIHDPRQPTQQALRHINSKDVATRDRYLKHLGRTCHSQSLLSKMDQLLNSPTFDFCAQQSLNELDHELTQAMLQAELHCSRHQDAWSPILKLHKRLVQAWRLIVSSTKIP